MVKTAFVFPGQGSQYVGMGFEFAERNAAARLLYERASEVLGFDLLEMCRNGPAELLRQTENTQPAILVTSLACLEAARDQLPSPVAVAGLSLGEYTALVEAGVLTLEDAVRLVRERGLAMQAATAEEDTAMLAIVGLGMETVEQICEQAARHGVCCITNYNAPTQMVVGGHTEAVAAAKELALAAKAYKAERLAVSTAFHTPLVARAAERMASLLEDTPLEDACLPIISDVTGEPVRRTEEIRSLLIEHITRPVLWVQTVQRLRQEGIDWLIEFGPGRTLSRLTKAIDFEAHVGSVENPESLEKTLKKRPSQGDACNVAVAGEF